VGVNATMEVRVNINYREAFQIHRAMLSLFVPYRKNIAITVQNMHVHKFLQSCNLLS
jgi:hypothetical protein